MQSNPLSCSEREIFTCLSMFFLGNKILGDKSPKVFYQAFVRIGFLLIVEVEIGPGSQCTGLQDDRSRNTTPNMTDL